MILQTITNIYKNIEKYWILILTVFGISMLIKPAFCILILGFLALFMGVGAILFTKKIQKAGIECTGRILSFGAGRNGHKIPIIEFAPVEGEIIAEIPFVYASSDLSIVKSYKEMIDKEVMILYDPDDPKRFILRDEKGSNYFAFTLFILAGLVFITVSIGNLSGYIKFG